MNKQLVLQLGDDVDPSISWARLHQVSHCAGVDEAGRGPLAGPVYAAAVVLDPDHPIVGLDDSKRLSERQRDLLAPQIKARALACAIGIADVEEIDRLNILEASKLAMLRAISGLNGGCDGIAVDGNQALATELPQLCVVKGDQKCAAIAAASILAKTSRDAHMVELERLYPGYGFAKHKGYGTAMHLAALQSSGVTPVHRRSFAPVRKVLERQHG